jgi:hypothetical protein
MSYDHDDENDNRPRTLLDILNRIFTGDSQQRVYAQRQPQPDPEARERARYQEGLITELLTTFAGKGLLTNAEARDVIARAKERVAKAKAETPMSSSPTGCLCPMHDMRPHKVLDCAPCHAPMPHLIEGTVARCRRCLTARSV